ncbi:PD-(D/E)XK nuclease family protein [uncultured Jannaschia sp.]|uniref:PDDEXK-like family protein n=1 Tax=uncultured Jannaschia sp. TaxID=293347 RepID=UPI00263973A7|nr:PD-(D/E)XK nuclease family protein [uncultured Jannaschia sp.]
MTEWTREFLDSLSGEMPRCDVERHGAERYGSPRLSVFELLGMNENTLSDVIAELLDPRGTHGQGVLFLNAFLRAIDEPGVHGRTAVRVVREFVTRHGRRIDILIETPTSLIGIENKPFAGQSENQLSDYHFDLVTRAGERLRPRLVFLSDSDPMTAKDKAKIVRFHDQDDRHPSLIGLLNETHGDIRSPRARAFVEDFCGWVTRNLGDEVMTDELEPYAEEVLSRFEHTNDRKAIGAVMLAGARIRHEVIDRIGKHILDVLSGQYPDVETEDDGLSGSIDARFESWTMRRPSWPENCFLAIEGQSSGAKDICYGIVALKQGTSEAERYPDEVYHARDHLEAALQDVANGSTSDWYPWYRRAPTPNWSQEYIARLLIEADGQVELHDDVKKMTADIVQLAGVIEGVCDRPVR